MKQVSQALLNYLHSRTVFYMCDLYDITLQSGLTFSYAAYDMDIQLPNGRLYTSKGPLFKRNKTKLAAGISVDTLSANMYVDGSDTIGGAPLMHVAHNGGFDEAKLTLYKCFMDMPGVVIDAVKMFSGDIDIDEGGGLAINMKVKSKVRRLNVKYPLRNYYPGCPYSVYDSGCKLNQAAWTVNGNVTQQGNQQVFYTDLQFAAGFYDQGGIEFLSGALSGVAAPIKASANGGIVLLIPLAVAPAAGDQFRIYPGCDKRVETCNRFGNLGHNRATPYIPLPEAIV